MIAWQGGRATTVLSPASDVAAWPGRLVSVQIDDSGLRAVLECWLVRMARAGGKSGKAEPAAAAPPPLSDANGHGAAAAGAFSGALSSTVSTLFRPPHAMVVAQSMLRIAPILQALLERHHEVIRSSPAGVSARPLTYAIRARGMSFRAV